MNDNYKTLIFDYVDKKIRTGEWKPGEKIFSENQFAIKFECSRHTARNVLHDLVLLGILDSAKGRGYYISSWADKLMFRSIGGNIKYSKNNVIDADSPDFDIEIKKKWLEYFGVTKKEILKDSNAFYKTFYSGKTEVIYQKMYINKNRVHNYSTDDLSSSSIKTIESNRIRVTNHASLIVFPDSPGLEKEARELGWTGDFPIMIDMMSDDKTWLSFTIKIIRKDYFEVYSGKRIL